ncbi:hypothetical protein DY000_02007611 [Brassica cretica]|uniref:Uncharacterized protein n=1 Tax=Brassica cretica TaxID=69181 RepID=A0ABQ7BYZ6_BRACR|nr:hypothetical protein DY000_02007611 [Brassica cretica]
MRRILHLVTGGCIGGSNQRQSPTEQTSRSHRPGKSPMGTGTSTEEVHRSRRPRAAMTLAVMKDPHLDMEHPLLISFDSPEALNRSVEGIYRALESTEERLDGRCDDIYFPMDLSIRALTSKIEAIQGELMEIQSYIVRRPEASPSIDRRNKKSTDIHQRISVDKASNRGRLVQKISSDMSDTHNHGEEISADTYARLMRHQFNLESLGDRLQKIEDATTIMKEKWHRGDEAMRDFTNSTKDTKADQPVNYVYMGLDSSNKYGRSVPSFNRVHGSAQSLLIKRRSKFSHPPTESPSNSDQLFLASSNPFSTFSQFGQSVLRSS